MAHATIIILSKFLCIGQDSWWILLCTYITDTQEMLAETVHKTDKHTLSTYMNMYRIGGWLFTAFIPADLVHLQVFSSTMRNMKSYSFTTTSCKLYGLPSLLLGTVEANLSFRLCVFLLTRYLSLHVSWLRPSVWHLAMNQCQWYVYIVGITDIIFIHTCLLCGSFMLCSWCRDCSGAQSSVWVGVRGQWGHLHSVQSSVWPVWEWHQSWGGPTHHSTSHWWVWWCHLQPYCWLISSLFFRHKKKVL